MKPSIKLSLALLLGASAAASASIRHDLPPSFKLQNGVTQTVRITVSPGEFGRYKGVVGDVRVTIRLRNKRTGRTSTRSQKFSLRQDSRGSNSASGSFRITWNGNIYKSAAGGNFVEFTVRSNQARPVKAEIAVE